MSNEIKKKIVIHNQSSTFGEGHPIQIDYMYTAKIVFNSILSRPLNM